MVPHYKLSLHQANCLSILQEVAMVSGWGRGVLMYICYMGMCHPNESYFHNISLIDMGLLFKEKPFDMGPFFQNVPNFGCLPPKISKIFGCSHV